MSSSNTTSKKVILLGHFGVGKTSLVKQFVTQKFSEEYHTTIGVKVDKKVLEIGNTSLTMILWDIEGGVMQSHLPQSYFLGAQGIIFVFDLLRPATWENMDTELGYFKEILPKASIRIIGNKKDLLDEMQLQEFENQNAGKFHYLSSAKTGENVEELFMALGIDMLK
jgi:small GTP-binding protein